MHFRHLFNYFNSILSIKART